MNEITGLEGAAQLHKETKWADRKRIPELGYWVGVEPHGCPGDLQLDVSGIEKICREAMLPPIVIAWGEVSKAGSLVEEMSSGKFGKKIVGELAKLYGKQGIGVRPLRVMWPNNQDIKRYEALGNKIKPQSIGWEITIDVNDIAQKIEQAGLKGVEGKEMYAQQLNLAIKKGLLCASMYESLCLRKENGLAEILNIAMLEANLFHISVGMASLTSLSMHLENPVLYLANIALNQSILKAVLMRLPKAINDLLLDIGALRKIFKDSGLQRMKSPLWSSLVISDNWRKQYFPDRYENESHGLPEAGQAAINAALPLSVIFYPFYYTLGALTRGRKQSLISVNEVQNQEMT